MGIYGYRPPCGLSVRPYHRMNYSGGIAVGFPPFFMSKIVDKAVFLTMRRTVGGVGDT